MGVERHRGSGCIKSSYKRSRRRRGGQVGDRVEVLFALGGQDDFYPGEVRLRPWIPCPYRPWSRFPTALGALPAPAGSARSPTRSRALPRGRLRTSGRKRTTTASTSTTESGAPPLPPGPFADRPWSHCTCARRSHGCARAGRGQAHSADSEQPGAPREPAAPRRSG